MKTTVKIKVAPALGFSLDPVLNKNGVVEYFEMLCRPSGTGLDYEVSGMFRQAMRDGVIPDIDMEMAGNAVRHIRHTGMTVGLNIAPVTIIEKWAEILRLIEPVAAKIVIEIVEWDRQDRYRDDRIKTFIAMATLMGARIALDDIGDGYFENLVHAMEFDVGILKAKLGNIEKAFLVSNGDQLVVAEFVKTRTDAARCHKLGVDCMQGTFVRKAISSLLK